MSVISEAEFVDLYLGDGFADVKGLPGSARRVEAPCDWRADLERLRMQCIDKHAADPRARIGLRLPVYPQQCPTCGCAITYDDAEP